MINCLHLITLRSFLNSNLHLVRRCALRVLLLRSQLFGEHVLHLCVTSMVRLLRMDVGYINRQSWILLL